MGTCNLALADKGDQFLHLYRSCFIHNAQNWLNFVITVNRLILLPAGVFLSATFGHLEHFGSDWTANSA